MANTAMNSSKDSPWERMFFIIWAAGFLVGIPEQLYAFQIRHDSHKSNQLFAIALAMFVPLLVYSLFKLRRLHKQYKELEFEVKVKTIFLATISPILDSMNAAKETAESIKRTKTYKSKSEQRRHEAMKKSVH